jgi:Xaa-Pro aminopeptidase
MIRLDPPALAEPRRRRVEAAAQQQGLDGWLLTTSLGVRMVAGARSDRTDLAGEFAYPLVAAGDAVVEAELPADEPAFAEQFLGLLPRSGKIAIDRVGLAALERLRELRPGLEVIDAALLIGAAQNPKDSAEVDVIIEGHHRTEAALRDVLDLVVPGITERELNDRFAVAAVDHGLQEMHVDTVFTALPRTQEEASWARGAWAEAFPYRELTGERELQEGDHVAFDAGFLYQGYMTDVGWTLLVGRDPTPEEVSLADRWREVANRVIDALRPGANAAEAREAALRGWPADGPLPWPQGLYVAHGIGLGGVEPPFIGAGFAPETEAAMAIVPGQTILVEPYVFADGVGGYRAEYAVVVREHGAEVVNSIDVGHWHVS